ncbi:MAG: hypothetical protein WBA57_05635 [Elainellaceae cyanobacterium]
MAQRLLLVLFLCIGGIGSCGGVEPDPPPEVTDPPPEVTSKNCQILDALYKNGKFTAAINEQENLASKISDLDTGNDVVTKCLEIASSQDETIWASISNKVNAPSSLSKSSCWLLAAAYETAQLEFESLLAKDMKQDNLIGEHCGNMLYSDQLISLIQYPEKTVTENDGRSGLCWLVRGAYDAGHTDARDLIGLSPQSSPFTKKHCSKSFSEE